MTLLFVGLGGFIGAVLRFLISGVVQKHFPGSFPVGTLTVNVLGSFVIGFLVFLFENLLAPQLKAFLVTGTLGALTTFSTFSFETAVMIQEGALFRAVLNILLNVVLCILATFSGMGFYRILFRL